MVNRETLPIGRVRREDDEMTTWEAHRSVRAFRDVPRFHGWLIALLVDLIVDFDV